jgi:hypothetical protein
MCPNRIDTSAGSSAEVGSSRMMIRASLPIALAIATMAFSSGLSALTSVHGSILSPTRSSSFAARFSMTVQLTKSPTRRGRVWERNGERSRLRLSPPKRSRRRVGRADRTAIG